MAVRVHPFIFNLMLSSNRAYGSVANRNVCAFELSQGNHTLCIMMVYRRLVLSAESSNALVLCCST